MIKMPVSYKEFAKDPVKALLFIALSAIVYLYIDNKMNYQGQVDECVANQEKHEQKIDELTEHVRVADSALAAYSSKFEILVKLNKIEGL